MNTKKITDFTTEELLKQKKLLNTTSGALAGGLSVLVIMIVLLTLKSGFTAITTSLSIIPIALLPIVFSNIRQIKLIKKELEIRNFN